MPACWSSIASCTVLPRLTRPLSGVTVPAIRPSSVDLPAPFAPRMPVRSPGPMRHSTSRSTGRPSNDTDTSSRSTTSLPSRAVASLASSTVLRSGGTSAISALAASMRNLGLDVRAGAPAAQPRQLLAHQVLPLGLGRRGDAGPARPAAARRPRSRRRTARRCRSCTSHVVVATSSRNQRSWVTNSSPPVLRAQRRFRCAASQVMPSMSRWLVGSSRAMTSQSPISSAASCTRRRCPPRQRRNRRIPGDVGHQPADDVANSGVAGPLVLGACRRRVSSPTVRCPSRVSA